MPVPDTRRPPAGPEPSDEALLNQVAQGDDRAMKMLYLRHHALVHGFVRRRVPDDVLADVVQDVFFAVFKRPQGYGGGAAFGTYLCAIAKHKIADRFRAAATPAGAVAVDDSVLAELPDEARASDVLVQVGRRQALAHIEACMAQLPEVQRDALFWTYFQDERDHEVAERLGVAQGTVKSRLNAARLALKRCLVQRGAGAGLD